MITDNFNDDRHCKKSSHYSNSTNNSQKQQHSSQRQSNRRKNQLKDRYTKKTDQKRKEKSRNTNKKETESFNFLDSKQQLDTQSLINFFYTSDLKIYDLSINKKYERYIIQEDFLLFRVWNLLISLILFQILMSFPFEVSEGNLIKLYPFQVELNMVIEVIFIIDIILNFFTTFRDKYDVEISDHPRISLHYLQSWFFLDVISSVPVDILVQFELISSESPILQNNNLLRLLKLPKQLRILKILKTLRNNPFIKQIEEILDSFGLVDLTYSLGNIAKTLFIVLTFIHFQSCIYVYQVTKQKVNWYQNILQNTQAECQNVDIHPDHDFCRSFIDFDAYYLHHVSQGNRTMMQVQAWQLSIQSVVTVGQGDISAVNTDEQVSRLVLMIVGGIVFIFFASSITEFVLMKSFQASDSIKRKNQVEFIVDKYNLPKMCKDQLEMLIDSVQNSPLKKEQEMIDHLPPSFNSYIMNQLRDVFIERIEYFSKLDFDMFIELFQNLTHRKCTQMEDIQQKDEEASQVQFVYMGMVAYQSNVLDKQDIVENGHFKIMEMGSSLGFGDCLFYQKQLTGSRSQGVSDIVYMRHEKFMELSDKYHKLFVLFQESKRSLRMLVEHLFAIQIIMLILEVEGMPIKKNDQISMAEILHIKTKDIELIINYYHKFKNVEKKFTDKNESLWFKKYINRHLLGIMNGKMKNLLNEKFKEQGDKENDNILEEEEMSQHKFLNHHNDSKADKKKNQSSIHPQYVNQTNPSMANVEVETNSNSSDSNDNDNTAKEDTNDIIQIDVKYVDSKEELFKYSDINVISINDGIGSNNIIENRNSLKDRQVDHDDDLIGNLVGDHEGDEFNNEMKSFIENDHNLLNKRDSSIHTKHTNQTAATQLHTVTAGSQINTITEKSDLWEGEVNKEQSKKNTYEIANENHEKEENEKRAQESTDTKSNSNSTGKHHEMLNGFHEFVGSFKKGEDPKYATFGRNSGPSSEKSSTKQKQSPYRNGVKDASHKSRDKSRDKSKDSRSSSNYRKYKKEAAKQEIQQRSQLHRQLNSIQSQIMKHEKAIEKIGDKVNTFQTKILGKSGDTAENHNNINSICNNNDDQVNLKDDDQDEVKNNIFNDQNDEGNNNNNSSKK